MDSIPLLAPCLVATGAALLVAIAALSDRAAAALCRGYDARPLAPVVRGPNMTRGDWTPGKAVRHVA